MIKSRTPLDVRARSRELPKRWGALALAWVLALALLAVPFASPAAAAAADDGVLRVLLFYKDNFHASHVQARQAVRDMVTELGGAYGQPVEIEETQDPAVFTAANLSTKDTLVFAQTGGVLFNDAQRAALEDYIRGGGGYLGLHYAGWSVGQSEHDVNPFYARLVGAVSEGHPEAPALRPGRVVVKDAGHPLTQGLPAEVTRTDEWYDWVVNPAPDVRTLLVADEASYATDATGGRQGTTHPITWCQQIDAGRSWYTGMGHAAEAYAEPLIRTQMRNGLAYTAGLLPADCSPPVKGETGAWSDVTPWPLVPINAALTSDGRVQSFGSVATGCTDANPYDWTGNTCVAQGGQFEIDVWDPAEPRTLTNLRDGIVPNTTYTDLFCAMQVQDPHRHSTMTVGGDDGLGDYNDPVNGAVGVTSYSTNNGLQTEAPMVFPRWYPTGTTMPNGDIVVQGGSVRGVAGPGVHTPEIRTADEGSGWRALTGATSSVAYGDGGADHPGQDENRWWYPRAFVAPGSGTLFNITGTQMYELDPAGDGTLTLRGTLPAAVADQGALGRPVGATSTATMYRPGKILQVGGGWWANGGGPDGARGGFTVDITGGTANPVIAPTQPMQYQRHWATSTVLPDGDVLVTGGGRENNGRDDTVTNPEIWDPETGEWTTVEVPHEHARLYHSTALLLPDGRVMMGGGGTPGPRNYTDVEFYSPAYLFDGDEPAERPTITDVPDEIGYAGTFDVATSGEVSRVTLVRNGSVTHGFNNDQNFQDLEFAQTGPGTVTITAPQDGTYAPPGAYMLFVFDGDGTPSVASILTIDPEVPMDTRTPQVVDQFEYPRVPTEWRGGNPPAVVDVASGTGRMAPWSVGGAVQLVRAAAASNGGLGAVGYHLALGAAGSVERTLTGLDPGREYRISLRYARDSRSAGTGDATARLAVGSLDTTLTATAAANPSQSTRAVTFGTFTGTFTPDARTETLTLSAPGAGAGLVVDDLVVISQDPSSADVPVRYTFDEGSGTTAANTGTDGATGPATLTGATGWTGPEGGALGAGVDLPGGAQENVVDLPDSLLVGAEDFTVSLWANPDALNNWTALLQIGNGLGNAGSYFQLQSQTQTAGNTGLAATFKDDGAGSPEERVLDGAADPDLVPGRWNHVAFTREGSVGVLYLNGVEVARRGDLTISLADLGPTTNNWLGRNGYPDAPFAGSMDDVRAYRSALTADAIAAMYAEGSAVRTSVTVTATPDSPAPFGEDVTVSAVVEPATGTAAPAGTAQLVVDGVAVGGPVALDAQGEVTFPALVDPRPGAHTLEVRYVAAEGFRDASGSTTYDVSRPPPPPGVPVHYRFDETSGTAAANSGTDATVGAATLVGGAAFAPGGQLAGAVDLPGGGGDYVDLPDDLAMSLTDEFTVSLWARPDQLRSWTPLFQIGNGTDTFFLLQSQTQALPGGSGLAATFKAPGNPAQERLVLGGDADPTPDELAVGRLNHVVFTMSGSTGRLYLDGVLVGERTDFTLGIDDVGVGGATVDNYVGNNDYPDPTFDGLVDDVRIYGYELSGDQVAELFEGEPEPVNTAPVAAVDEYATEEGTPLTVAAPGVLANDTDADGDPLTAAAVSQPINGTVTLAADGSFTYTPDPAFSGTDLFTYTAHDGAAASEPVRVTVRVRRAPPPATTTLTADVDALVYGQVATVAVGIAPTTATGDVTVRKGSTVLGTATLAAGAAAVALPAGSLVPGTHLLTVSYPGDARHTASTTYALLQVEKVTPTMTVGQVRKTGRDVTVQVQLSAPGGVPVTGTVEARIRRGATVSGTLTNGSVVLTLPRNTRSGTMDVVYLGSALANPVTRTVTFTVR